LDDSPSADTSLFLPSARLLRSMMTSSMTSRPRDVTSLPPVAESGFAAALRKLAHHQRRRWMPYVTSQLSSPCQQYRYCQRCKQDFFQDQDFRPKNVLSRALKIFMDFILGPKFFGFNFDRRRREFQLLPHHPSRPGHLCTKITKRVKVK